DWPSVGSMLIVTLVIGAILVPVTYLVLPRGIKRIGTAFTALAVIAPLGLIAPGFAYGEGSSGDLKSAFGYVPSGLQGLSGVFSAPFAGYDLPFLSSGAHAPLWHAGIGYEISGILGMLAVGGVVYVLARLLRRSGGADDTAQGVAEGVRP
ncbi:MAG TPA: hypothetical protein VF293_02255, partial [Candidatus Limnocylindrales bacterium]